MKLYAIHSSACSWQKDVPFLQEILFHGAAQMLPGRFGRMSHNIGDSDMRPMELHVNGYKLPDLFMPMRSNSLVVSRRIMNDLQRHVDNCLFLPVRFARVINLEWNRQAIDRNLHLFDHVDRGSETAIFRNLAHDPDMASSLGEYFELVSYSHYHLVKRFAPTHKFFVKNYDGKASDRDLLPVSEQQFSLYPVSDPGYTVLRDSVFDVIRDNMELMFFGTKVFDFQNGESTTYNPRA